MCVCVLGITGVIFKRGMAHVHTCTLVNMQAHRCTHMHIDTQESWVQMEGALGWQ